MMLTLAQAKTHLGVTDDSSNTDVLAALLQAEDVISTYLTRRGTSPSAVTQAALVDSWGTLTGSPPVVVQAPKSVQRAILELTALFYAGRGDDPEFMKAIAEGHLPPMVAAVLAPYRLPVFA